MKQINYQKFTGTDILRQIPRLGYTCTQLNDSANVQMPLRHAALVEGISRKLSIPVRRDRENSQDAILNIKTTGDTRLILEMLAAARFLFFVKDPGKNIAEPALIEKPTGFFIYQMEWERISSATGKMGAQNLIILPGGHIPLHTHKETEEIFKLFRGAVTFHMDGKEIQLQENSRIEVPIEIVHGAVSSGNWFALLSAWKPTLAPNDFYVADPL
ncbi:MAG: cupin domain-containing protein [Candidatus Micrarchaeota archaeon]|nr:cupin domain-containing protein [Candidatus Micrarchaeota archaeon]